MSKKAALTVLVALLLVMGITVCMADEQMGFSPDGSIEEIDMSSFSEEELAILAEGFDAKETIELTPRLVSVGGSMQLNGEAKVKDKTIDIPLSYKAKLKNGTSIGVSVKVKYSAVADTEYRYDRDTLPGGYMRIIETISFDVKTEATVTPLDVLDLTSESKAEFLTLSLSGVDLISVSGTTKIKVDCSLIGNCSFTMTRVKGCIIDSFGGSKVVDEEPFKPEMTEFEVSGKCYLGISGSIGMSVPVLGQVCGIEMEAGLEIGLEQEEQYDHDVICFDVPVTFKMQLSVFVKVGVSAPKGTAFEGLNWTLIKKYIPLHKAELLLAVGHLEMVRYSTGDNLQILGNDICLWSPDWRGWLYRVTRNDMEDRINRELCSVKKNSRKTLSFYTGTLEKIDNEHTVVGQAFDRPRDPTNVNKRVHFVDWYTDLEGEELFNFDAVTTENTEAQQTAYAHWSEPYYNITIDMDTPGIDTIVLACPPGTYVEKPYVPLRMGYHFDKFVYSYVLPGGVVCNDTEWIFERDHSLDQDITIRAIWIYEEGYNPYEATAIAIRSDEEFEEKAREDFKDGYSIKLNTWMTGAIAGRVDTSAYSKLSRITAVTDYKGTSSVICIPEHLGGFPVTYVDGTDFSDKESVEGLILPGSVQFIRGFKEYPNLQYVYFMDNEVPISSEVGQEDDGVFRGVTLIEKDCFRDCPKLTHIVVPSSIEYIGNYAFSNTGLEEFKIDYDGSLRIGDYIFAECSALRSVQLPWHEFILTTGMFKNCSALKDIDLSGVRKFYNECLRGSGLETIHLSHVEHIGQYCFLDMPNLTNFYLDTADEYSYSGSWSSFSNCPNLKTVYFGAGLISANISKCPKLESLSFWSTGLTLDIDNLESLRTVNVEGKVTKLDLYGMNALESVNVIGNVESLTVNRSNSIQSISISQNVNKLYLYSLPELSSLYFGMLNGTESSKAYFTVSNCPKLKLQEGVIGDYVKVSFDNAGFAALNFSELPGEHSNSVSISNCESLQTVVLPKADDAEVSISQSKSGNPQMIIVPAERESFKISSGMINSSKKPVRIVLEGEETSVQIQNIYSNRVILVASQGSSAWQSLEGDDHVFLLTPEEAAAGIKVALLDYNSYYMDVEESAVKVPSGKRIPFPPVTMYNDAMFTGWTDKADNSYLTYEVMPNRDVYAYGNYVSTWSNPFTYQIDEDGGAIITGYAGDSIYIGIPEMIDSYRVTGIAANVFSGDTITEISLPAGIQRLDPIVFNRLTALQAIRIQNEKLIGINGIVFERDSDGNPVTLVYVPQGTKETLNIPETVVRVAAGAVEHCNNLAKIVFQSDPVIEENSIFGCMQLSVYGPIDAENLEAWCNQMAIPYNQYVLAMHVGDAVYERELSAGALLASITVEVEGYGGFIGWTEEEDVGSDEVTLLLTMPARDTSVWAIWDEGSIVEDGKLISVTAVSDGTVIVPDGVTSIASGAVQFSAERILIPSSVLEIENGAFKGKPIVVADADSYAQKWAQGNGCAFERRKYTLRFETNGGAIIDKQVLEKGEALNLPTPVRTWAVFSGWFRDEACTDHFNESFMPGNDTVLFAGWVVTRELCFTWNRLEDGGIRIDGYYGEDPDVVIPADINGEEVVSIAPYAFYQNETVYKVSLPDGIREIGERAFWGSGLHEISFGSAAPSLGGYAFADCNALMKIEIPEGIKKLPEGVFSGCDALVSVTLPDTLKEIENDAFDRCVQLHTLIIPGNLEILHADGLLGAALTSILVKDSNKTFSTDGSLLFTDAGATLVYACGGQGSIHVPDGVKRIGDRAFFRNTMLTTVSLPDSLESIGDETFLCTNLSEITLPAGIISVGERLFPNKTILYVATEDCSTYEKMHESYSLVVLDHLVRAESIRLSQHEVTIQVGQSVSLTASVLPENATDAKLTWTSSDGQIVMAEDGVLTAKGMGEAVVQAMTERGLWDYCVVTVVQGCELEAVFEQESVLTGHPIMMQVTCSMEDMEYRYVSSDQSYAPIKEDGTVIANREGTYTFTVYAYKDDLLYARAEATIRAFDAYPCTSFDLSACFDKRTCGDTEYYWFDSYQYIYLENAFQSGDYNKQWIQMESGDTDVLTVNLSDSIENSYFYVGWGHTSLTVTFLATGEVRYYLIYAGAEPDESEEPWEPYDEWSEPEYLWAEDYATVTASRFRVISGEIETETETVPVSMFVFQPPTEDGWGMTEYFTDEFENDAFVMQYLWEEDIPPLKEMKTLRLPIGTKRIQKEAFAKVDCEAVILPEWCTVEEDAFKECEKLIYVYIPYGTEWDENAFRGCTKVRIYHEWW